MLVSRIDELAIVSTVLGWVDQRASDFNKVRSEAIRAVKEAFDSEAIDLDEAVQIYRELPAPRPAEPSKTRAPSAEELREIKDTSRDTTIERKVEQRRATADNDLLTEAAPRE